MMMIECTGDNSKTNGERNKYSNCSLGPNCTNRGLGQRNFAKTKPQREQGKGWGLVTMQALKEGDLVVEYVGEVIDESTKNARLVAWSRDHPNDTNFYIMQLQQGWYIDARQEANTSRFINHSCDPNCELKQFNVNGYMRVGIFATKPIAAGDFLSYDYRFDTRDGDKFVCRCGSKNCRGTMKGLRKQSREEEGITTAEAWEKAMHDYDKAKRFLDHVHNEESKRFNQVDVLVPNASSNSELVSRGPLRNLYMRTLPFPVFLWRNAIIGEAFHRRSARALLQAPTRRHDESKGMRTATGIQQLPPVDVLSTLRIGTTGGTRTDVVDGDASTGVAAAGPIKTNDDCPIDV